MDSHRPGGLASKIWSRASFPPQAAGPVKAYPVTSASPRWARRASLPLHCVFKELLCTVGKPHNKDAPPPFFFLFFTRTGVRR